MLIGLEKISLQVEQKSATLLEPYVFGVPPKTSDVPSEVTIRRPVESNAYPLFKRSEQKECPHDLSDKISHEEKKRIGK